MKLVRFGAPGAERPGVWLDDTPGPGQARILDVRAMAFDIEDYNERFFAQDGVARLRGLLAEPGRKLLDPAGLRLGPPIARPSKIVCLGKNYRDHALEFDSQVPTRPIFFSKATSALAGAADPIELPADAGAVDTEAELAVVIGRSAKGVSESEAMRYIAGYTILNDITDRDAQRAGLQWFFGKGADGFAPLGPWLVTADAVPDPHALRLYAKINGQTLQEAHTGLMIFRIPYLIAFLSARITLLPGDVISTGTPGGIGSARQPPVLLRPGDETEIGIEGLGVQRARVR